MTQTAATGGTAADSATARRPNALLQVASLVVVIAGLKAGAQLLVPLVLALLLALMTLPLLRWLIGHGLRPTLAVAIALLADLAVLGSLIMLLSGALAAFADGAPFYLEQLFLKVKAELAELSARGLVLSDWVVLDRLEPAGLMDLVGGVVSGTVRGVTSFLGFTSLVLLTMAFMLAEAVVLPGKLRLALGRDELAPAQLAAVTRDLQHYLWIKTLISFAAGALIGLWLWVLGVDFALLWGFVAFLLHYVPMLGAAVAAIPTILFAWLEGGTTEAALVGLGYLLINFTLGNLVEPLLMGRRFGLSTLVVFMALGFWGWVWGPVGMLLSVPLTMGCKILLQHVPELAWVAVLLGKGQRAAAVAPPPVTAGVP